MKARFLSGLMLLALVFVPFSQGWAGEVLEKIAQTNTLRVGMTGTQPPFNVKNKDGVLIGMDVDLARVLAQSMNVRLEIVEMPFSELLDGLVAGEVDLVISGVTATLKRNQRVAFVGPYYISGKSILTKSKTVAAIQQAEEMNSASFSIATLAGSTGEEFIKRVAPNATVVAVRNYEDGISQLIDDKVDAFLADAPIIQLTAMRYPDAGLASLNKPLTLEPIGIAVAPNDPLLLNLVQNYMRAVEATGALDILSKKWFQSGSWLMQLPQQ